MFWSHSCIPVKTARGCRGLQKNISIRRNAQKLAKAGQVAKAIQTYLPILESDADPYDYLYVGDLCVKAGDLEGAVGHYQSAIAHYRKLGFHRNAIALCRKILRIDSSRHDVHRLLGTLYAADDLVGDALESYAIYLASASPEEREQQTFRDGVAHACELAPRRATLALHLSQVLIGLNRTDDAADVLLRSAEVAHESGERDLASELLAKAAELDPGVTERVGQMLATRDTEDDAEGPSPHEAGGSGNSTDDDTREEVLAEIQTTFESIGAGDADPPERPAALEDAHAPGPPAALEDADLPGGPAALEDADSPGGPAVFDLDDLSSDQSQTPTEAGEPSDGGASGAVASDGSSPARALQNVSEAFEISAAPTASSSDAEDGSSQSEESDTDSKPHRDTMTCSGVKDGETGARRSISFREIDLDADETPAGPSAEAGAATGVTGAGPAVGPGGTGDATESTDAGDLAGSADTSPSGGGSGGGEVLDEDDADAPMPGVIEIDADEGFLDAGHLANPATATRLAIEAEQYTVAAKRVEEWIRLETQSQEAAEKLIEISEALQDNAGIVRGLILLGDLCIQEGDLPAAVPHFRRALTLDSANETVQRRLVRFAELGMDVETTPDTDEASAPAEMSDGAEASAPAEMSDGAEASAPADVSNPGTIEEVLSSKEALVDVRAGESTPGDSAHQEWMELGALLEEFQEGIKQQVGEDDAQAHYDLGVSHMEMELYEEALAEFEQALAGEEAAGDFARRLCELRGTCLSRLDRHREAIHEFRQSLEGGEGSSAERNGLRYLLAREYQAVGEIDAAKESLRSLLEEQPEDREASALLAEIEGRAA